MKVSAVYLGDDLHFALVMRLRARNVNKPDTDFDSAPSGSDATMHSIDTGALKAGEKKKKVGIPNLKADVKEGRGRRNVKGGGSRELQFTRNITALMQTKEH